MTIRELAFLAFAFTPVAAAAEGLTLEQIMADADWLGNQPENAYWGADSAVIYFQQKRQGSELRDLFMVDSRDGAIAQIAERDWSQASRGDAVYDAAGDRHAWTYAGDVFLSDGDTVRQVTRTAAAESAPTFMNDGRLAFQRDGHVFLFDPRNGFVEQISNLRFEKDPAEEDAFDVMRAHQERLYEQLRKAEKKEDEAREHGNSLYRFDEALSAAPIYMGDKLESQGFAISPDGKRLLLVTSARDADAGKRGTMPNYVTLSGYTETREVRTRVGRNGDAPHSVWLIDLESGDKHELDLGDLPGMDEDPLADLRASAIEHYVALGEDRDKAAARVKAPETRGAQVFSTLWSWDGSQVLLWVRSTDNKDRWIATVDFDDRKLVNQHRLTDEAWNNWNHIEHGWLKDNQTIWFLSEDHDYLGIYTKHIGERRSKARVAGKHVVFDPELGPSGKFIYYQANVEHPGIYEIWRLELESGKTAQLTTLGGFNEVSVSPDESKLLITHSELDRHPELYVQDNVPGAEARQLTDTMSEAFKRINWRRPEIVAIPSSHVDAPIYTKVYLPADHDPARNYPAVVFVHGAGYLQNADYGWPDYFREGMFHSLLNEHGYVVIDMDYRASEGYGREWRTAIYRRMGVPELEDYVDGVNYMVENYGVDRDRIGIYGGSYGGFMAFVAMFKAPDLFKAGAALRPVSDWAHYNHGYTSNILNTPGIDPEAYYISSPINYVEGLKNPLLIEAGMQDDNVFFQDSVFVVQRLIELQKENFEIALYPQDPHGFKHPESWLDGYRRIYKLFEENLK
ncbi:MAG: prolyl oligopeptidase family serine peptidase [Gammaproteobacteria bacterium]|nr:prolyl oligopeptidase family serine peptidase [Gammaproteobacteria bacterium]MDH5618244.1 prolyl oligopeptidase family serine peptidase [Gammaproteobacteria bacterium]